MIVDSSAIVAILNREPEGPAFIRTLDGSPTRSSISAANYLETAMVVDARGDPELSAEIDALLADLDVEIVPVWPEHARLAREAHRRFGRGSGSGAKLNFGDCFAYALARATGEPLLFKGDDFGKTDILTA